MRHSRSKLNARASGTSAGTKQSGVPATVSAPTAIAAVFVAAAVSASLPSVAFAQTQPGNAACAAAPLNWMQGAYRCTATAAAAASGSMVDLQAVRGPNRGSATFACSNGAWSVQRGGICKPQPSLYSESDPIGSAANRLNAITLSDSEPGYVGTQPLSGTNVIAAPSQDANGFMTPALKAVTDSFADALRKSYPPNKNWWATRISPAVTVMEPGQTVVLDVVALDTNGKAIGPANQVGQVSLTTKWQSVDGTIVEGFGSAKFLPNGQVQVTAPANGAIGRLLVSLQAVGCNRMGCDTTVPGVSQLDALFSGELIAVKGGVVKLAEMGAVQLPQADGSINSAQFSKADLKTAMTAFRGSQRDRTDAIGYPLVISGAAPIAAGRAVDLRLQGVPMGGTVFSAQTRGSEQLLVVALDPAEAYNFAKYSDDAVVAAKLVRPNPISTYNSDPKRKYWPGEQTPPAAAFVNSAALSTGKQNFAATRFSAFSAAAAPDGPCAAPNGATSLLHLQPVLNLFNGELGLYISAQVTGVGEIECKWSLGSNPALDTAEVVAGALVAAPVTLIAGTKLKPKPYGEIKLKFSGNLNTSSDFSYTVGYATGDRYGPKSELKLPRLDPSNPLDQAAAQVKVDVGGEIGIKSEIRADATGGAIGLALLMTNAVTGEGLGEDSITVKSYVSAGVSASLPTMAWVYNSGGGAEAKVAAKAGVKAKLPKLLTKYMDAIALSSSNVSLKKDLVVDATIAEAGVKMAFAAETKPNAPTGAVLTKFQPKVDRAVSSLLAYDRPAKDSANVPLQPGNAIAAPKDRNLSFWGKSMKAGGLISGTSDECKKSVDTPFISNVGPFVGISNQVHVCDPSQRGQKTDVNSGIRVPDDFDNDKLKVLTYVAYGWPNWTCASGTVYSPRYGNYEYVQVYGDNSLTWPPFLTWGGSNFLHPCGQDQIPAIGGGSWGFTIAGGWGSITSWETAPESIQLVPDDGGNKMPGLCQLMIRWPGSTLR